MYELILASQSPRRKQILQDAHYQFHTFPTEVSEILNKNLNLPDQISDCARQKAEAAATAHKDLKSKKILILAADTLVVHQDQVIGKPKNKKQAHLILEQLSGQIHHVITGFCLLDLAKNNLVLGHEKTEIHFKDLANKEIQDYIETGAPMDKAGAYGIQGGGGKFVKEISARIRRESRGTGNKAKLIRQLADLDTRIVGSCRSTKHA